MDRRWLPFVIALALVAAVWNLATFTVPQWMQAVVLQLGDPVRTIREPGLYFKIPFIQSVIYFDKRLLDYDASPKELLTRDKQQLVVDNYTRWRIIDPLQFYRAVRDEMGAKSRLDDIVYSNLRENFGRQTLQQIVSRRGGELMDDITKRSDERARDYGIEILDVRIKRADLPEKNEQNVFSRMRTERERLAKKFRAEGEEEAAKIRSASDKEATVLMAEAQRESQIRRGQGDADAIRIFAESYGRDPEFFELVRTLEAYRASLAEGTTLILSPDGDFFRYLKQLDPPDRISPPRLPRSAAPAE